MPHIEAQQRAVAINRLLSMVRRIQLVSCTVVIMIAIASHYVVVMVNFVYLTRAGIPRYLAKHSF